MNAIELRQDNPNASTRAGDESAQSELCQLSRLEISKHVVARSQQMSEALLGKVAGNASSQSEKLKEERELQSDVVIEEVISNITDVGSEYKKKSVSFTDTDIPKAVTGGMYQCCSIV